MPTKTTDPWCAWKRCLDCGKEAVVNPSEERHRCGGLYETIDRPVYRRVK